MSNPGAATSMRGELLDGDFEYRSDQFIVSMSYYAGRSVRWAAVAALPFGRTEADSDRLHMPLGSYEPGPVVRQGDNAWSAKGEANLIWRPRSAWTVELTTALRARRSRVTESASSISGRRTEDCAYLGHRDRSIGNRVQRDAALSVGLRRTA